MLLRIREAPHTARGKAGGAAALENTEPFPKELLCDWRSQQAPALEK